MKNFFRKKKENKIFYLHIKYSHDGKTFSDHNGKELAEWVGQYIDSNKEDSTIFEDYNWIKKEN